MNAGSYILFFVRRKRKFYLQSRKEWKYALICSIMGLLWKKDFSTVGVDGFQDWSVSVGLFILLSVMTFSIFTIWDIAAAPFNNARSHAVAVATEHADLQTVNDFSIYNGTETYFCVFGVTSQEKRLQF